VPLVWRGRLVGNLLPRDFHQVGLESRLVHEVPKKPSPLGGVGFDCADN
jgi:hypothetical protein